MIIHKEARIDATSGGRILFDKFFRMQNCLKHYSVLILTEVWRSMPTSSINISGSFLASDEIDTSQLSSAAGGTIEVSSLREGTAENLNIAANLIRLDRQSSLKC